MFFSKHLKKPSKKDEEEFSKRMEDVPFIDKLIMVGTAFVVIVIPCLLILVGMSALIMWMMGLL